jgi:hypothetical protein
MVHVILALKLKNTFWICGWVMQYPHQKGNMGWFLGGSFCTKKIEWFMCGWCNICIWQGKYVSTMKKENKKGKEDET